jgi:hypothetical protein
MRFEVGDPLCGAIDFYPDRASALKRASEHQREHGVPFKHDDSDAVSVFDRMARVEAPNRWSSEGKCIGGRRA